MKILFYCNTSIETLQSVEFYKQDIDALRDAGHEVIICTKYRDLLRGFDAVFIWWWSYALFPILFAKLLRKKAIVTGTFNFRHVDFDSKNDYFGKPLWKRALIYAAARLADLNIFVNRIEYEQCTKYFKLKKSDLLYHSVGDEYAIDRPPSKEDPFIFNIAWSGSSNLDRKGIFVLLEAIAILVDGGEPVKLVLAGRDGDGKHLLHETVRRLGIESNVYLRGEISKDEKIRLLGDCTLYVQPSKYEGFGLALAEAMATGATCLVTPVGALPEVVGDAGDYVPSNSPTELAERIKFLLHAPVRRTELGARASIRVRELFSYKRKVDYFRRLPGRVS